MGSKVKGLTSLDLCIPNEHYSAYLDVLWKRFWAEAVASAGRPAATARLLVR